MVAVHYCVPQVGWRLALAVMLVLAWFGQGRAQVTLNVSNPTDWNNASTTIFNNPNQSYVVNINSSFTMTGPVPPLRVDPGRSITINGNGNTIDGNNQFRPLFVLDGQVNINNLTVANGRAQGGNGGSGVSGGGGGMGAGGGLFVNDTATVTLTNVNFTNNNAVGGNGGSQSSDGPGGGGGLGGNGGAGGGGFGGGGLYGAGGGGGGFGGGGITGAGGAGGNFLVRYWRQRCSHRRRRLRRRHRRLHGR